MPPFPLSGALIAVVAFGVSLLVTPLVRAAARARGAVAQPKSDRWHSRPTAMFGGVAIFISVIVTVLVFVPPRNGETWAVLVSASALFIVGAIDDVVQIKPYQKLIAQLLTAAAVVWFGLVLPWTGSFTLNMLITFVWLVGITNAVNMLDNMDGLATGTSAIAASFLAFNFFLNHQPAEAMMLGAFAGALLGFLVYNHHPASIFMGDCGSMFIGFFLSGSSLLASVGGGGRSRSVVAVLAVPVLVLCIPIFDTTFVTLMRKLAGRAASQGGRDHTSHRLVALGLSEKHAVWMLYAFAFSAGILAVVCRKTAIDVSVAVIAAFVTALTILGVYLGRVRVYDEREIAAAREKPLVAFLVDLSYKRRIFEVGLDVVLILLANYAAYALVFGPAADSPNWQLFLKSIPAIVAVKLAAFGVSGVYRGMWKYASLADVVSFARAVALSSFGTVMLLVFAFRFEGFSRTVIAVDAVLLLLFVTMSRFAFRVLRRVMGAPHSRTGKRVLIFGAGDGGELLWRELNNNAELQYVPVAFADDDPQKSGRVVHGLRVHSGARSLAAICSDTRAEEVFLSSSRIPVPRLLQIIAECETAGIPVKRMQLRVERVADTELGWVPPSDAAPALVAPSLAAALQEGARLRPADKRDVNH